MELRLALTKTISSIVITISSLVISVIFLLVTTFPTYYHYHLMDNISTVQNTTTFSANNMEQDKSITVAKEGNENTVNTNQTTEPKKILTDMKDIISRNLSLIQEVKARQDAEVAQIAEAKKIIQIQKQKQEQLQKQQQQQQQLQKQQIKQQQQLEAQNSISITPSEKNLMERLVQAEAGGEPYSGKLAVATVIVNRLKNGFGNNVKDVIYANGQFTPVANGTIKNTPSSETRRAVYQVVSRGYRSFSSNVVYFCNPQIAKSKWMINKKKCVTTIGRHSFYSK